MASRALTGPGRRAKDELPVVGVGKLHSAAPPVRRLRKGLVRGVHQIPVPLPEHVAPSACHVACRHRPLAQVGWEVYVLDDEWSVTLEIGTGSEPPPRGREGRYKRPYEGTDNQAAAMQAYLDWEYGLVAQLERDCTHGFFVI